MTASASVLSPIGPVPDDWALKPLQAVVRPLGRKNVGLVETNLLSLSYGSIIRKDIKALEGLLPESFDGYQIVEKDDLVFRFTDLQNDQRSLRSGLALERGIITSAYLAVRPTAINPMYFAYLMRAYDQEKVFYSFGGGVRQSLKFDDVKRLPIPVPSVERQRRIAEFLDRETAQIDELIAKQEQLISTLAERRKSATAILLRDQPKLHSMGTPQRSEGDGRLRGPLKRFVESLDRIRVPLSALERESRSGPYPYYGASGVIDHVDSYLFHEPLVLVSEDGANLVNRSTPVAFEASGKYWVNNHAHILKPRDGLTGYWARVIEDLDFRSVITGSAQPKLTIDALMNFPVSVPESVATRERIHQGVLRIEKETETAVERGRMLVSFLRERRQALISAAVTGQIDVGGAS